MAIFLIISGCTPYYQNCERQGHMWFKRGFLCHKQDEDLNELIKIRQITVYVIGDNSLMPSRKAGLQGWATPSNKIYVIGRLKDGKIVLNQAVLGHEVQHILNFSNEKIENPDRN